MVFFWILIEYFVREDIRKVNNKFEEEIFQLKNDLEDKIDTQTEILSND